MGPMRVPVASTPVEGRGEGHVRCICCPVSLLPYTMVGIIMPTRGRGRHLGSVEFIGIKLKLEVTLETSHPAPRTWPAHIV